MAQVDGGSTTTTDVKKFGASETALTQSSSVQSPDSYPSRPSYAADLLDEFAGMDEDCLLGEPTIVKDSRKQDAIVEPPALPQKSSLRASRILDSLKLSSIESATQSLTTPHDSYMSSEEDASSSADEFSESEYDSCSEVSQGSSSRRRSYGGTARVVSFIYSGKPFLVELPSPRRSTAATTTDTSPETASPIETSSGSSTSVGKHPPRTSSLIPTGQLPAFLKQDPFADTQCANVATKEDGAQRLAKAVSTVTTLNRVQRTFSLVRKRSRPFLRTNTSFSTSKDDIAIPSLPHSTTHLPQAAPMTPQEQTPAPESSAETTESPRSPVRYNDIIKSARKVAKTAPVTALPPTTPTTPLVSKRGLLSGFKPNRRSLRV